MTISILNDTYTASGKNEYGYEIGTVQIDLGHGQVVLAKAQPQSDGHRVDGFVGRYVTSAKPWRASVSGKGSALHVYFGRDDRSGRFNKANAIRWEPELAASLGNPEYWVVVGA